MGDQLFEEEERRDRTVACAHDSHVLLDTSQKKSTFYGCLNEFSSEWDPNLDQHTNFSSEVLIKSQIDVVQDGLCVSFFARGVMLIFSVPPIPRRACHRPCGTSAASVTKSRWTPDLIER